MRDRSISSTPAPSRRSILSFTAPLLLVGLGALTWGAWASALWWSRLQSREKADAGLIEKMMVDPAVALDYATDQIIDGNIPKETYKTVVKMIMRSDDTRILDVAAANVSRLLAKNGSSISNNANWFPTQVIIYRNNNNAKSTSQVIAENIPAVVGRDVLVVQREQPFPWKESSVRCKISEICGDVTEKIANYLEGLPDLEKVSNFTEKATQAGPNATQSVADKQLTAKNVLDAKRIEIFLVAKAATASTNQPPLKNDPPQQQGRPAKSRRN